MARLKSGSRIYGNAIVDNQLQITSGPILVGTTTATGTTSQPLQVTGSAYVSGNLGIGSTNPSSKLHVVGNVLVSGITTLGITSTTNLTTQNLNVSGVSTFSNGPVLIGISTSTGISTQRLQVSGGAYISGNLGIGTTNPTRTLSINGDVGIGRSIYDSTNSSGSTGQVLQSTVTGIGWTSFSSGATLNNTPSGILYPTMSDTTVGTYSTAYTSSSALTFTTSSGTLSATQFTSLSDASKKINIRPIENAIELTKQLNGVRFDWKQDNKSSIGVIAQDIEKIIPEVVETNEDGTKSVSYGNLIGVLIEAIKEQQLRIEELERKIDA